MDSSSVHEDVHQHFKDLPSGCQSTPKSSRKRKDVPSSCQSTPKITKKKKTTDKPGTQPAAKKFSCQYCDKTYVSKYHFNKHVQTHTSSAAKVAGADSDVNESATSVCMNISQNVTFSLLHDPAGPDSSVQNFKKPAVPTKKKATRTKATFICTYCLKGYVCNKSFKNHMRTHVIQNGASRFPDKKSITENANDISVGALTKTAEAPVAEATGHIFRQLIGEIIAISSGEEWCMFTTKFCEHLVEFLDKKKCMLPSALLSSLLEKVEGIHAHDSLCTELLNILPLSDIFNEDVKSQIFLEFSLNYVYEVLSYISKTFRSGYVRVTALNTVPEIDNEDREVIYYIGGSIMRGYFRIAYRYKSNSNWDLIAKVIKSRVLCDKPCYGEDAKWTRSVDRGGLLYPNEQCQNFLVALTKEVFLSEKSDGSIDYELVLERVSNHDISIIWDQLIFDALPETVSLSLMNDVVLCFCRTCGRGFAKRRINLFREKPVVSMPTRHLVATRKTK